MKNTKKNKRLVDKNFKHKKFLIVIIIFAAWFVLGSINAVYKNKNIAQKADIFLIEDGTSQYGETEIIGKVQKDTAVGVEGNYFLLTADNKYILIDTQEEMDGFIGSKVVIKGFLTPATNFGQPETIKAYTLKLE